MIWHIGQEVGILREAGVFKVCSIEKDHLLLEDENGFTYRYLKLEVVSRQQISIDEITPKEILASENLGSKKVAVVKTLPFVDLHAEELSLPGHLSAHDVFLAQISAFKHFCNIQAHSRIAKFIVIHGAGEGKLKEEIRQIVLSRSGISMHDAQWSNGAVGASRIELMLSAFVPF
jgi:hypothetical protein